jgi:hypothetical protein
MVPEAKRRGQSRFYRTVVSDRFGKFALRNVEPGDYKLFAWEGISSDAFMNPEFLQEHEGRGEPVRLQADDHVSLQLRFASSR